MKDDQKIIVNEMSCRLLEKEYCASNNGVKVCVGWHEHFGKIWDMFDIFTRPADTLAVIEKLADIRIVVFKENMNDYRVMRNKSMSRKGKKTYMEAIAEAVMR